MALELHGNDRGRDQIVMTDWQQHDRGTIGVILVGAVGQTHIGFPDALKDFPQIAVDGGIHTAIKPVLWCGDGDSGFIPDHIPAVFKTDQSETDFSFCLEGIRGWVWSDLHLFNFLGARRAHELACFGAVHAEMTLRPKTRTVFFHEDQGEVKVAFFQAGEHEMTINGSFSVMTLEETALTLEGACLYKGEGIELPPLSGRGISNEGSGVVAIRADRPFMVLFD